MTSVFKFKTNAVLYIVEPLAMVSLGNRWFLSSPCLVTYYSFIIILEMVKNSDLIYLEPRANLNLVHSNKIMRQLVQILGFDRCLRILSFYQLLISELWPARGPGCRAPGLEIVNQSSVQPVLTRPARELGQKVFNSHISSGAVDHFTYNLLIIIFYRVQNKVLFSSFFSANYKHFLHFNLRLLSQ